MIKLSELRRNKGLSQNQLVKELKDKGIKISSGSIAMYEIGQRTPPLKTAILIAQYFDMPVEKIRFSNIEND